MAVPLCGTPPSGCAADTLFYPGSDVDVQVLRWLQPFERRAIFVDQLAAPETLTGLEHVFPAFEKDHANDPRLSYRNTTRLLRRMRDPVQVAAGLDKLIVARLRDTGFTSVESLGGLRFSFVHENLARELIYINDRVDSLLAPDRQRNLEMCGRISTFVLLSFGHEVLPELLLSMTCLPKLRFVVNAAGNSGFLERLQSLRVPSTACSMSEAEVAARLAREPRARLPFRQGDAFGSATHTYAICEPANHSFAQAVRDMQRRIRGETAPLCAPRYDVLDAFEPQHRHHQQRPDDDRLRMKMANVEALWGLRDATATGQGFSSAKFIGSGREDAEFAWPASAADRLAALRMLGEHLTRTPCLATRESHGPLGAMKRLHKAMGVAPHTASRDR